MVFKRQLSNALDWGGDWVKGNNRVQGWRSEQRECLSAKELSHCLLVLLHIPQTTGHKKINMFFLIRWKIFSSEHVVRSLFILAVELQFFFKRWHFLCHLLPPAISNPGFGTTWMAQNSPKNINIYFKLKHTTEIGMILKFHKQ